MCPTDDPVLQYAGYDPVPPHGQHQGTGALECKIKNMF